MPTKLPVLLLLLAGIAPGEILPDAPHLQMRPAATYAQNENELVHNSPSSFKPETSRIVDWQFLTAHGIYGASVVFDDYVTARNVGTCAFESNPDLGRLPTPKAIAFHGAVEFAVVVAGDAAMKWLGRRNSVSRWVNELGGNLGAIIGTARHVHGGTQWVKLCN
jgi:hypothetical protein